MKNKKEILIIFLISIILFYIFKNTDSINNYIIYATKLWFFKVFPFLFPMIILNELLLSNNILYYINKIFRKNGIKYYVFIMSLLSGSPTSAYLIKELFLNKIIDLKNANKLLYFTHFSNPVFLISILTSLFDKKTAYLLIIFHYLPNFIMMFFTKIESSNNTIIKNNNYNKALDKAVNTSLMVLGTLCIYIALSNIIIDIFNISSINSIFIKGIIEITQGLNEINSLFVNIRFKKLLAIIFINFGGLSIHSQIKSIISDTPISYKCFLLGRLYSLLATSFYNIITFK